MQDHERAARQSLIDTCIGMNASGLSLHKSGNASLRWGGGLLITPTVLDNILSATVSAETVMIDAGNTVVAAK